MLVAPFGLLAAAGADLRQFPDASLSVPVLLVPMFPVIRVCTVPMLTLAASAGEAVATMPAVTSPAVAVPATTAVDVSAPKNFLNMVVPPVQTPICCTGGSRLFEMRVKMWGNGKARGHTRARDLVTDGNHHFLLRRPMAVRAIHCSADGRVTRC